MRPHNDPFIDAIAERIRTILARQPASTLCHIVEALGIAPDPVRQLIEDSSCTIDPGFAIDIIAALVRECAVDPQWLLSGKYDGAVHRRALLMGESRDVAGEQELREFIHKQYRELRSPLRDFLWSGIFGSRV